MLTAINRIVRQLRRIAYTVNDSLIPWPTLVHEQEWAKVDAQLLRTASGILAWIAQDLFTLSTTVSAQESDALNVNYERKEQVIATLDAAHEQLITSEDSLRQAQSTRDLPPLQGEHSSPGNGYHLSLRGTILTDLRRILQELSEILALLPLQ
jgi:hypothetical protein